MSDFIKGIRYDGKEVYLVEDNSIGKYIRIGHKLADGRIIEGGRAPHKEGSTGRVYVDGAEFFPSVIGCKFMTVVEFGNAFGGYPFPE